MFYLTRLCRPATRVAAVAVALSSILVVPVAVSSAASPDAASSTAKAGARSATAGTQIFGLPVVTAAWALIGLMSLVCGLALASRGARSFRAEPQTALASGMPDASPGGSPVAANSALDGPGARFGQSLAQSAPAAKHSFSDSLRLSDQRSEARAAI